MLYLVMYYRDEMTDMEMESVPTICFDGDYMKPAVFESRADAVKYMNELQELHTDTGYFVQHTEVIRTIPEPTL